MKKNIIIVILAITSILSVVYGRYQKTEALRNEQMAIENARLAREVTIQAEGAMKLAQEQRDIALANATEAMRQAQIANEALEKSNKAR
mgnify:CR=1 FL=1